MALRNDGQRRCDWCLQPHAPKDLLPIIAVFGYHVGDEHLGNTTNLICAECWVKMCDAIRIWKDRAWKKLSSDEKVAILHGDIAVPSIDT